MDEKKYTYRALDTDDIFTLAEIVQVIGIKDLKSKILENVEKTQEFNKQLDGLKDKSKIEKITKMKQEYYMEFAFNFFTSIIIKSKPIKNQIYEFFGSLVGISGDEFRKLKPDESIEIIMGLTEVEGFSGFFNSVSKLI
jgi:hypothetical protein